MNDLQRRLTDEREFQRTAALLGVFLLLALSMPLSVARAISGPEQMAAAVTQLPPAAFGHVAEDLNGRELIYRKLPRTHDHTARRSIPRRPFVAAPAPPSGPALLFDAATPPPGSQTFAAVGPASPTPNNILEGLPDVAGDIGPGAVFPLVPVSPVPEPTAWIMMILGVGIIGAALRLSGRTTRSVAAEANRHIPQQARRITAGTCGLRGS